MYGAILTEICMGWRYGWRLERLYLLAVLNWGIIFLMNYEQILNEALRLTDAGDDALALPLWEKLRKGPCNTEEKCFLLLNERRCLSSLGNFELAETRLRMVEEIDTSAEFKLHVESARLDDLNRQNKTSEYIKRAKRFLEERGSELASPRFQILAYESKQALACALISSREFDEGLQIIAEILPTAEGVEQRRLRYFRSLAYQHTSREEEAIAELKLVISPGDSDLWTADAHYDLGIIYQHRSLLGWAKYHLQSCEILKDVFSGSLRQLYDGLSYVCESLRESDEAKRYAKLARAAPQ